MKKHLNSLNIKSIIALLMAVMMLISVSACSNTGKSIKESIDEKGAGGEKTTEETKSPKKEKTKPAEKKEKDSSTFDKNKKYATDYELEMGETAYDILGRWDIQKCSDDDGKTMLDIRQLDSVKISEIDEMDFFVYDNEELANKRFKKLKERSRECDRGEYWEEGDCWFISKEPDVYDAKCIWMVYVECNIVIIADISTGSGSSVDEAYEENSDRIRDYVIEHSGEIQDYVDNEILQ